MGHGPSSASATSSPTAVRPEEALARARTALRRGARTARYAPSPSFSCSACVAVMWAERGTPPATCRLHFSPNPSTTALIPSPPQTSAPPEARLVSPFAKPPPPPDPVAPPRASPCLCSAATVRHMLDLVISTSGKLVSTLPYPRPSLMSTLTDQGFPVETYEDKDNARKDEISNHLSSQVQTEIFPKFYDRLKEIRDYHRHNPSTRFISETDDFEELLKEEPAIEFTGEVFFLYQGYLFNSALVYLCTAMSYFILVLNWISYYLLFIYIFLNSGRQYREYLEHILEYLTSFLYHTEPLQDTDKIFAKLESEFEEQWANGGVPGWENKDPEKESAPQESVIDLDYYTTVEELVELGPEKLKEALAARGLKSGGTVQQRAERLFLLKHTPLVQLDRKHFAKGSHGSVSNNGNSIKDDLKKEIALMEIKMMRLCELLDEIIVRTKENAEKKLTLTYEEMEAEREEREARATVHLLGRWIRPYQEVARNPIGLNAGRPMPAALLAPPPWFTYITSHAFLWRRRSHRSLFDQSIVRRASSRQLQI
ncbi:hypothetical protein ABZP36_007492, partial [Zizania latifolia]